MLSTALALIAGLAPAAAAARQARGQLHLEPTKPNLFTSVLLHDPDPAGARPWLYPTVTSQYSPTASYQVPSHIPSLFP